MYKYCNECGNRVKMNESKCPLCGSKLTIKDDNYNINQEDKIDNHDYEANYHEEPINKLKEIKKSFIEAKNYQDKKISINKEMIIILGIPLFLFILILGGNFLIPLFIIGAIIFNINKNKKKYH